MPETTRTAKLILTKMLTGGGYTVPTWQVGLSKTTINIDGTGATEPVGGSYGRRTLNASNWNDAENSVITNASPITFLKATSSWGTIKEIFISDGTNICFHQPLMPNITVDAGTTVIIPPGCLIIKRDSSSYETG